ncbi:MAG TPA: scaffolding protein [Chloroflexi bacterium]|nr:scaffolding protein [Chloroflexota bacterium]
MHAAMSVQAKPTPNPNAMKFVLPARIFARPLSFASAQEAAAHPLAAAIFALGGVYNVFMVQDFVTVNKLPDVAWETLLEPIQKCIEDFLLSNL